MCNATSNMVVPKLILKYTRSDDQWQVSLRPPNVSLAAGITSVRMVVLPGAQNVFALGTLQWRVRKSRCCCLGHRCMENAHRATCLPLLPWHTAPAPAPAPGVQKNDGTLTTVGSDGYQQQHVW